MIAEKAGVQRHTLYAHFPDERSIFMACSGLAHERDPIPTADAWRPIADQVERLATALGAIYGWYGRNASLLSNVMREDVNVPCLTPEQALSGAPAAEEQRFRVPRILTEEA